jgi:hypothetical protein
MLFKTKKYEIVKINRKTKEVGFKDLTIGDKLEFSIKLKDTTGASRGGRYALDIKTIHLKLHPHMALRYDSPNPNWICTQNQFLRNIDAFELKEVYVLR